MIKQSENTYCLKILKLGTQGKLEKDMIENNWLTTKIDRNIIFTDLLPNAAVKLPL